MYGRRIWCTAALRRLSLPFGGAEQIHVHLSKTVPGHFPFLIGPKMSKILGLRGVAQLEAQSRSECAEKSHVRFPSRSFNILNIGA